MLLPRCSIDKFLHLLSFEKKVTRRGSRVALPYSVPFRGCIVWCPLLTFLNSPQIADDANPVLNFNLQASQHQTSRMMFTAVRVDRAVITCTHLKPHLHCRFFCRFPCRSLGPHVSLFVTLHLRASFCIHVHRTWLLAHWLHLLAMARRAAAFLTLLLWLRCFTIKNTRL